jgi:hypothetical protein
MVPVLYQVTDAVEVTLPSGVKYTDLRIGGGQTPTKVGNGLQVSCSLSRKHSRWSASHAGLPGGHRLCWARKWRGV